MSINKSPTPKLKRPEASDPVAVAQAIRESSVIAMAFSKDFEELVKFYNITDFEIWVLSPRFQLRWQKKNKSTKVQ
jgi:hypothetical protein